MRVRGLCPLLVTVAFGALAVAAALAFLLLNVGTTSADGTFNPTTTVKYCNALPATFPDPQLQGNIACTEASDAIGLQAGGAANVTTTSDIAAADYNFSNITTFVPAGTTITDGATIPPGTKLGGLRSAATLGLLNAPCDSTGSLVVDFVLFNVALPNVPGDPRTSSNIAFAQPGGTSDRFGHWKIGSVAGIADPAPATGGFGSGDVGFEASHANGTTLAIQNYPSYLLDLFDPDKIPGGADGPLKPIVPRAVYGGLTKVAGQWVPLYFVQFLPSQLTPLPGVGSLMPAALGAPNVAVLNDTTEVVVNPSDITDFCAPLLTNSMLLGKDPSAAFTRATNPPAGTQFTVQYLASLRDTDQDGFENQLDTCPTIPNIGNPKLAGDSAATGGLDAATGCIPSTGPCSGTGQALDCDGDGFKNRLDNCPVVANGGASQTEISEYASPAADYGPRNDGIGDACDSGTITIMQNGHSVSITLSSSVPNGRYLVKTNVIPKCFGTVPAGGTDADGDGYCLADDNFDAPGGSNAVRHKPWGSTPASAGLVGAANLDSDGDGFTDAQEAYLGTDATKKCAQTATPPLANANDEGPLDNWPFDFNDDGKATTQDVGKYIPVLNLTVDVPPASVRFDLNQDGIITTADVGKFIPVLNAACSWTAPFQQ